METQEPKANRDDGQVRPWVRYWARSIDIYLLFMVFNFIIERSHLNIDVPNLAVGILVGASVIFVIYTAWVPVEALLLAKWGYTPGKWLLKVSVTGEDRDKLSYGKALRRAIQVYIWGNGLYIPIVNLITNIMSYEWLKEKGTTRWDRKENCMVTHGKIGFLRAAIAVIIIAALTWINR